MYYHRVGDTVEQTVPTYFYQWWDWDRYITTGEFVKLDVNLFKYEPCIMSYFYTPTPIKVIGISGMVFSGYDSHQRWWLDTPDSLLLYDADSNGLSRIISVPWRNTDDRRYLHITSNGEDRGSRVCCTAAPWSRTEPVFEYYFDTSYTITDSFYVGCTQMFGSSVMAAMATTAAIGCDGIGPIPRRCRFPYNKMVVRSSRWVHTLDSNGVDQSYLEPYGSWHPMDYDGENVWYLDQHEMLMVFPIIEIDTTVPPPGSCVPVENVQVTPTGIDTAVVTWDGFPNYDSVEVQYGMSSRPYSLWTTIGTNGTMCIISGFDLSVYVSYGVRVRAICEEGKKVTPWSEPVYFMPMRDTTTSAGVEAPGSALARSVVLQPNPAKEEVMVFSDNLLQAFEIYTTKGYLAHSDLLSGRVATVSLDGLPAGTYIFIVHTLAGTTTKKLVKQ